MDMSVGGIPWLDQPVMLHSSRQDKCKLPDAQCAYRNTRWRYWYALQVLPLLYYRGLYHLGMQVPSRPCICPEHGLLLLCGYCDLYYLEYPRQGLSRLAQKDSSMACNDFNLPVHILSGISVPDAEVLVSIFGCHHVGYCGRNFLLRYVLSFNLA
jgi:hypothetical protein